MKKIIIGLSGDDHEGKGAAASVLESMGFHRISIHNKVKEICASLQKTSTENNLDEYVELVRLRGYNISERYWINIVMANLPDDKLRIVIDDMREEDAIDKVIMSFFITKDSQSKGLNGFKTIRNVSDEESFRSLIRDMFEKFSK